MIGLALTVSLYLIATGILFVVQRQMIYPAPHTAAIIEPSAGFQDVTLRTDDGLQLRAIYRSARGDLPTLIFFHGNGDGLDGAVAATQEIGTLGYGVLLPEYRGYGGNPGSPSEAGLYRDGEAALRWLRTRGIALDRIVLVGNSLGGGVATELATRHPIAGLVLASAFTSLADVAALHMRMFPVRLLLRDRYENRVKLPRVQAPVLIVHGASDTLIPATHGVRLASAAKQSRLIVVPGIGHELAYLPQARSAIRVWLRAH